jgi:hypothetical protein
MAAEPACRFARMDGMATFTPKKSSVIMNMPETTISMRITARASMPSSTASPAPDMD